MSGKVIISGIYKAVRTTGGVTTLVIEATEYY
jgi:hypothetical protein